MTSAIITAIDPGKTGAIAFLDPADHAGASVFDMPVMADGVEPIELHRLILANRATVGVIEKVQPMPSQGEDKATGKRRPMGATSAFAFGGAFFTARTVLALCEIPLHAPMPGVWKKAMGLQGKADAKEIARQRALELFPHLHVSLKRKKDHNRAEALLLALYAARFIVAQRSAA